MRRLKLALANVALALLWPLQWAWWSLRFTLELGLYIALWVGFLTSLALLILGPLGTWAYQVYVWLRYGAWPPLPVDGLPFVKSAVEGVGWVGIRQILEFLASMNIGVAALILGVCLTFLIVEWRSDAGVNLSGYWEDRPKSPFSGDDTAANSGE